VRTDIYIEWFFCNCIAGGYFFIKLDSPRDGRICTRLWYAGRQFAFDTIVCVPYYFRVIVVGCHIDVLSAKRRVHNVCYSQWVVVGSEYYRDFFSTQPLPDNLFIGERGIYYFICYAS